MVLSFYLFFKRDVLAREPYLLDLPSWQLWPRSVVVANCATRLLAGNVLRDATAVGRWNRAGRTI